MKKTIISLVLGACVIGVGCQPPAPSTSSTTTTDSTTKPTDADSSVPTPPPVTLMTGVPANLQNDAYHYYGLSRADSATYNVTIEGPNMPANVQTGTETVKLLGIVDGKAKFSVVRTGGLAQMGSEVVLLDDKGVNVMSIDPGKLTGKVLDMPATLTPGTTWKTDYKIQLPPAPTMPKGGTSEDHSTFTVVGNQKVTTKAGTFDALYVKETGDDLLNGEPYKLTAEYWYAKDRGTVKILVVTEQKGAKSTITVEAVPGDPK